MASLQFELLLSAICLMPTLIGVSTSSSSNQTQGPQSRVFSGFKTRAGDMSFIGGLASVKNPVYERLRCTAFLIAPQWALTAAHCYKGVPFVFLANTPPERNITAIPIQNWTIHHDYNATDARTRYADIALLYLNSSVSGIDPVPIPDNTTDPIYKFEASYDHYLGIQFTIAGYGLIAGRGVRPKSLYKTYVYFAESCNASIWGTVDKRSFCTITGPSGQDACPGDSGAPVMFETAKRKLALGVHSDGDSACRIYLRPWQFEAFNVRISWYADWIKDQMCRRDGSKIPGWEYECPSIS